MPPFDPVNAIIAISIIVLSCSVHEFAHAWAANKLGDPTASLMGRLTLNPMAHLDPVQSVFMPAMFYFLSGGAFIFGGAKPVPIDHHRFKNPELGLAISAFAGPFSNFLLAALGAGVALILSLRAPEGSVNDWIIWNVLVRWVVTNIFLGAFNLVPIPPLDGSRILRAFLPGETQRMYDGLERFGLFLVMIFMMGGWFGPVQNLIIKGILSPLFQQIYELRPA